MPGMKTRRCGTSRAPPGCPPTWFAAWSPLPGTGGRATTAQTSKPHDALDRRPPPGARHAATLPRVVARFDSLRTERLLMRRWRDADRRPFAAMNADPGVMRHFPAPLDRAESDDYIDRMEALFQRQGFGLWALEEAGSGRFLGFTGLNPMPAGVPGAGAWRWAGDWPRTRGTRASPPRPPPRRWTWASAVPGWTRSGP